ncbi:hypothetical protein A3I42_00950 [Candidatus Uhrbacteria bacterium RIFCSPLOWO2_02_FULL_49_11]|uniref:Uncharacterized protein n=1 Tax=Candidatus Uhrbacteria bacterium RIFCSPLOWO2_02_FULL_49_11 TaxID=1802409 RepID=A0A1F7VC01_9BACT|nr:MAG: hypothetical protein A3I42_00950 [Candidatus Uhrbacteria bacterium RIFCSPLOWO2_02_FULL_49_11]
MSLPLIKSERRETKHIQYLKKRRKRGSLSGVHRKLKITHGYRGTARKIARTTSPRVKSPESI